MRNKLVLALALTAAVVAILALPVERGAARTGLSVSMYCNSAGYADGYSRAECFGFASGGSGNYYYDWTPNPLYDMEGYDYVVVPCARAYIYQTVYLTVTDLNTGATGSDSYRVFCGEAD